MSDVAGWLEVQCEGAPAPLRERAEHYFRASNGRLPERLAAAARSALNAVVGKPGDRSVALDLLAADALVTLALKAQAETEGGGGDGLERLAAELLGD